MKTQHTPDDENDAIRAKVESETPKPAGGFESDDAADEYRRKCDERFIQLQARAAIKAATEEN